MDDIKKLKQKLYGAETPVTVQVGDYVKAAIYPKTVFGHVTKIVGSAIFIDNEVCVHNNVVQRVPNLNDIGYASRVEVH